MRSSFLVSTSSISRYGKAQVCDAIVSYHQVVEGNKNQWQSLVMIVAIWNSTGQQLQKRYLISGTEFFMVYCNGSVDLLQALLILQTIQFFFIVSCGLWYPIHKIIRLKEKKYFCWWYWKHQLIIRKYHYRVLKSNGRNHMLGWNLKDNSFLSMH